MFFEKNWNTENVPVFKPIGGFKISQSNLQFLCIMTIP